MQNKVQTKWGEAYVFNIGDLVVAENGSGKQVVGTVIHWAIKTRDKEKGFITGWGGIVQLPNGEEFYPASIMHLRPVTKLDKALL
jgi:hypothetical protein